MGNKSTKSNSINNKQNNKSTFQTICKSIFDSKNNIDDDLDLDEYFALINKKAQKIKYENQTNKFNVSISLDKKDFSAPFQIKKYSNLEEKTFIHWKDYFINYLAKQRKQGFDWASDLLEYLFYIINKVM